MDRINLDPLMRSLLGMLESAKKTRRQADEDITEIASIIADLTRAAEDPNVAIAISQRIQWRIARTMFDSIRSALYTSKSGMTVSEITDWILMELAREFRDGCARTIPMTLRSMMEAGEVKEFKNETGKTAYVLKRNRRASAARINVHKQPKTTVVKSTRKPRRSGRPRLRRPTIGRSGSE